jgi:DNA-binding NtrC family response regulator
VEAADPNWEDLHRFASKVAGAVSAARLVLASVSTVGEVTVAMSVDRAGHGITDAIRFLRGVVELGEHDGPMVVSTATSGTPLPSEAGAVALMPATVNGAEGSSYLLYADRAEPATAAAFAQGDVEFLGAVAAPLATVHARLSERTAKLAHEEAADGGPGQPWRSGLITRNPRMLEVLSVVERLAPSRVPVLVTGESGVGKELVARAIHAAGRATSGNFVALNAGAIAPHLQESELFGHVRGAFTDAHQDREGLVAAADRGSLFLDEVGEMTQELQVKMLRFLQDGEYRRIGENRVRKSDARVVSATNKDLVAEMEAGRFRRDLLYRLCTLTIDVPPLRDRPEDVEPLMEHFLALYCEREGKRVSGFSRRARELLQRHDWRENNVRELENEVRRAIALCDDGGEIDVDKLSPELRERYRSASTEGERQTLKEKVDAYEKRNILIALDECGWNKKRAAERLGISRTGLLTKMKKYGIG